MNTNYNLRIAVFLILFLLSKGLFAQSPTQPAKNFNVFVENNLTLISNESEGPVAVGKDLTIAGNYQVAIHSGGDFLVQGVKIGLLVGGRVNYQSGNSVSIHQNSYVKIGNGVGSNVWYYDQNNAASPIRITPTVDYNSSPMISIQSNVNQLGGVGVNNNPVIEGNLIDFAGAFQQMRASSLSIASCQGNVQLYNANNQPIPNTNLPNQIRVELQDGINYLNLSGSEMNNVQVFNYNQAPSASKVLVINVDAPGTFTWNVWNQTGISFANCPYVIYNFPNTTQLNIAGSPTVNGTVFAPFADINKVINQSNIQGQVIGKSLFHSGGEMHYAAFQPSVTGCAPVGMPPVANFTVNQTTQCFNENNFVFTNTSTGNNVSYLWQFGDGTESTQNSPSKTYNSSGNYLVTLVATNSHGTDTKHIPVTVSAVFPASTSQSTISSGSGSVTKQFTLSGTNNYSSYSWSLAGQGTGLFPNQSVVNFEFTQAGYYEVFVTTVNLAGCEETTAIPVVISSEEVGTGNEGGLESESLGDAVSKRYVQRKMSSTPTTLVKTEAMRFNKNTNLVNYRNANGQTLLQMFPSNLTTGSIAHVTSPTDILDYTVAEEVLSVDFSVAGKTKAVVLGVRTANKIYNHTKASCDRLRGAEILNVKKVQIEGYNLLMQAIKQRSGNTEYAISFAVGKNTNSDFYSLQTNWFVNEYVISNDVYNFQVWATNPEYTMKLVKDILDNLRSYIPVSQTEIQKMPKTYVSKVSREDLDLVLKLKSSKESQSIEITMDEVYSETNGFALRYNPVMSELEQQVRIEIKDGYEYEGLVKVDGQIQDAFYHADGNWGLDFDSRYTTIQQYFVYNDFERIYEEDERPVHRNVKIQAHSEYDYLTLYKSLLPGNLPDDYTDYGFLSFTAKGSGLLEIRLVKSSVEQWKHQYRTNIKVKDSEQTYYIPFSHFKSTGTNQNMTPDDLSMITFTFLPVEAGTNDLDLTIERVRFTKTAPQGYEELLNTKSNEYLVYPNPSRGDLNCILYSESIENATVTLRDVTGKVIYSESVNLLEGRNDLMFNFNIPNPGLMFLNIASSKTDYGTTKVIIK